MKKKLQREGFGEEKKCLNDRICLRENMVEREIFQREVKAFITLIYVFLLKTTQ